MKTLYIKTYGCQMNEYDSARIIDLLKATLNIKLVNTQAQAAIILLNTCSVRQKAEEKVYSDLGRFRRFKKIKPELIIGVGGCVGTQEGETIFKRAPFVDLVFGPQTLHRLPHMIQKIQDKQHHVIDISYPEIEKFDALPPPGVNGPSAFVTIMEGCSKACTYCIVPKTRGKEISRPLEDVLQEIHLLVEQDVKEVNLLGQNVNNYLGRTSDDQIADLSTLLKHIADINEIYRIRFTTSHPLAFNDALIKSYQNISKIANHLHLPVQSGSDTVLKKMYRGYTSQQFKNKIAALRKVRPSISISSDFIVGFPGETNENFEDTLQLVKDIEFDHSFSFIYSPRPDTKASELKDDVPLKVKKERLSQLQSLLSHYEQKISNHMLNTQQKILVTGTSKKDDQELSGRTENNRVVNFSGPKNLIGQFINVTITKILPNSLRAEIR